MSCASRSAGLALGFSCAAGCGAAGAAACGLAGAGAGPLRASASRRAWAMSAASRAESFSLSMANSQLDEDDIELLLPVARLDLHRNGLADEIAEHREGLRLLLEEQVDHRLRREDAELARVELPRLAQDLAQDLVRDGPPRLAAAAPAAGGAGLAQHLLQGLAGALARHLDQAQPRKSVHGDPRAVARERLAELGEHRGAVVRRFHVDEIDDDDAPEVPQAQLARDHLRRLEIGLEDRVVEIAGAAVAAALHVDLAHRPLL